MRASLVREGAGSAAASAAAFFVLACGSIAFPERSPTIEGAIVGVGTEVPFGAANRIWVKEAPEDPCGIVLTADGSTEIGEVGPDGSIDERSFDDLKVGRGVRVWASGPVAESCPGQAGAEAIELLARSGG